MIAASVLQKPWSETATSACPLKPYLSQVSERNAGRRFLKRFSAQKRNCKETPVCTVNEVRTFYMDLPFQCLQPSFSGLCFLSFPFEGIYFVFCSRKELLINSSTSTLIVFHLPILVIALSFLLENFKRNLNPQLLMSSKS